MPLSFFCEICCRVGNEIPHKRNTGHEHVGSIGQKKNGDATSPVVDAGGQGVLDACGSRESHGPRKPVIAVSREGNLKLEQDPLLLPPLLTLGN